MKLGEAYVNVRADLKPYHRDLQAGLRATTAAFEKTLNKELGRRFGKEISTGARESIVENTDRVVKEVSQRFEKVNVEVRSRTRRSLSTGISDGFADAVQKGGKALWQYITSSLASALDDGISALPTEIKAVLATALIAATPIIITYLGAAINSAVALGVAGLGVLLAAQLQPVRDAFAEAVSGGRNALAGSAGPLIDPLLRGLDSVVSFIERELAPTFESIFTRIAPGVERLISGLIVAVDRFFANIQLGSGDINALLFELADAAAILGQAFGQALGIILASGSSGRIALRDLIVATSGLIVAFGTLIRLSTELYRLLRDIALVSSGNLNLVIAERAQDAIEDQSVGVFSLANEYGGLVAATDAETKAMKAQTQAAEANAKALREISDASSQLLGSKIDQEESWDRLTEAIKENGRSLDIEGEKGRENARNTQRYLENVKAALQGRVQAGEITAEEAERQFAREVTALEKVFGKTREGRRNFDELFGAMIRAFKAELDPSPWVSAFNAIGNAVRGAIDRIKELQRLAKAARLSTNIKVEGGTQLFADGGRITEPTLAMMGEGYKPELVLPETKPARAAQILANSGLSNLLGGSPQVFVFVGNEQLDSRMFRIVQGSNARTARMISQGPRSI